jgi:hypothetical protein
MLPSKFQFILAEGFRRRRLKCEKLADDGCQVMAKALVAFGKVSYKLCMIKAEYITDPLTNMATTGHSCFWLVDF